MMTSISGLGTSSYYRAYLYYLSISVWSGEMAGSTQDEATGAPTREDASQTIPNWQFAAKFFNPLSYVIRPKP